MFLLKRVALAMAMSLTSEGAIAQTLTQPAPQTSEPAAAVADADQAAEQSEAGT